MAEANLKAAAAEESVEADATDLASKQLQRPTVADMVETIMACIEVGTPEMRQRKSMFTHALDLGTAVGDNEDILAAMVEHGTSRAAAAGPTLSLIHI